jgi:RNase P subunit RPR2
LKTQESVDEAMDEQAWLQKSEEILRDIKEWRQAHPKASFVEIEDEVHKRMMQLEARVLQEAAQASSSREWRTTPTEEHPRCPKCQVPLKARGKHQRTLQGNGGQSVTLQRTYGTCPRCGESFLPSG